MSTPSQPPPSPSPSSPTNKSTNTSFPTTPYTPASPHGAFPYTSADFHRMDESPDTDFYSAPRFVTHIDDHAIALLKKYYRDVLPRKGRVLDLCSSWVSHFPEELEKGAVAVKERKKEKKKVGGGDTDEKKTAGEQEQEATEEEEEGLHVIGLGLNAHELSSNPILKETILQDLNANPTLPFSLAPLTATVCVVSIDYLTNPLSVLSSLRDRTEEGGSVHLVLSNRCFPSKAVGRWVRSSEGERVRMVGDYLWWSGWRGVEVVEVCDGRVGEEDGEGGGVGGLARLMGMVRGVDPLWVVRGVKVADADAEGGGVNFERVGQGGSECGQGVGFEVEK